MHWEYEKYLALGRERLAAGDLDRALEAARAAYAKRKQAQAVWQLLAEVYWARGEFYQAGIFCGLRLRATGEQAARFPGEKHREAFLAGLECGLAENFPVFRPSIGFDGQEMKISFDGLTVGGKLPEGTLGRDGYFVGVHNEDNFKGSQAAVAELLRDVGRPTGHYVGVVFDLQRMELTKSTAIASVPPQGLILPVAGLQDNQSVAVKGEAGKLSLAKYETNFLRIEKPTQLASDAPFAVGQAIPLGHSPQRRKVVLMLLADGLTWDEQKRHDFRDMPCSWEFFQDGIIFNRCYSETEYTYPSLSSISTGQSTLRNQLWYPFYFAEHARDELVLSEQMKKLGYYCVTSQGDGENIPNGTARGFDRFLLSPCVWPTYVGVERAIRQMEAFDEIDQYIFVHMSDSHPYNDERGRLEETQVHLPLASQLDLDMKTPGVSLPATASYQYNDRAHIRDMDRQLGLLFDYLRRHYQEDEYVVCLFSDHGSSVYSEKPWLLSNSQNNAALMLRGAGVPKLGLVEELASTLDIYKIIGHLTGFPIDLPYLDGNLPEALGGQRRELTVSHSVYPGQSRKICLRTDDYTCRIETENFTQADGTAKFLPCSIELYGQDDTAGQIENEELKEAFLEYVLARAEEYMLDVEDR